MAGVIRRVAAGIGMTAFDKLVIAGTQLTLVPILATRWGLEIYGHWLLLAALPQFLTISDFGFATAAGTRMTMAAARGDRAEAQGIFQSAWRAILASSGAILCLVLIGIALMLEDGFGPASAGPHPEWRLTAVLLAFYGVAAVQGSILFAGFRSARLFPIGAFWNAMVLLIENAALVITVLLGGGTVAAASAWLVGRLVALIGQYCLLRRKVPWLSLGFTSGSWAEARAMLAPAGAVMLLPLAQALVLQGTALVVGAAAGATAVPAFVATRTLSRVGMQLCWIVSTPLMPEFSAAVARRDRSAMATMLLATLLFSSLLVVPFAVGFMMLGGPAIALWTHGTVRPDGVLVAAMGLAVLFGGMWYPVSNLILACNRQAGYTLWYVALALASLPLSYALGGIAGAAGGALAMAALDLAMLLVVTRLATRILASRMELIAAWRDLRRRVSPPWSFRELAPPPGEEAPRPARPCPPPLWRR